MCLLAADDLYQVILVYVFKLIIFHANATNAQSSNHRVCGHNLLMMSRKIVSFTICYLSIVLCSFPDY